MQFTAGSRAPHFPRFNFVADYERKKKTREKEKQNKVAYVVGRTARDYNFFRKPSRDSRAALRLRFAELSMPMLLCCINYSRRNIPRA